MRISPPPPANHQSINHLGGEVNGIRVNYQTNKEVIKVIISSLSHSSRTRQCYCYLLFVICTYIQRKIKVGDGLHNSLSSFF